VKFNFPSLSVDAYEYQFKGCKEENNSTDDGRGEGSGKCNHVFFLHPKYYLNVKLSF
jgi:hypothetical protein